MVISHKHRYLFIELPRTGSTAISKELCLNYGGVPILYRHATYDEFLKVATASEKSFFVFSSIRNPLDDAVSLYFKYKNDHKGQFSALQQKGSVFTRLVNYPRLKRFKFIQRRNADFATYFLRFYRLPYNNWSSTCRQYCDYIVRFEQLQDDFSQLLQRIGIEQKRPLPVVNPTLNKRGNYLAYYTPPTIKRAKKVFGPFMHNWGYRFPEEWGESKSTVLDKVQFQIPDLFRNLYWKHMRPRINNIIFAERGRPIERRLSVTK